MANKITTYNLNPNNIDHDWIHENFDSVIAKFSLPVTPHPELQDTETSLKEIISEILQKSKVLRGDIEASGDSDKGAKGIQDWFTKFDQAQKAVGDMNHERNFADYQEKFKLLYRLQIELAYILNSYHIVAFTGCEFEGDLVDRSEGMQEVFSLLHDTYRRVHNVICSQNNVFAGIVFTEGETGDIGGSRDERISILDNIHNGAIKKIKKERRFSFLGDSEKAGVGGDGI